MDQNQKKRNQRISYVLVGVFLSFVLVLSFVPRLLFAGTVTGSISVTANSVKDCKIANTPTIAFGNYDPLTQTTNLQNNTGLITLQCTKGVTATIALDNGLNYGKATGYATDRAMSDGATTPNYLAYDIYTSNTYATIWNTTNTVSLGPFTSVNTPLSATLYAQIFGSQDVPTPDAFSDTVGITVTF
jgi:spore coat protein U-like protein